MSMLAYPLSQARYKYKKPVTFFIFFTMLFSGGLIPTYIWITRYLQLGDTIWVYILPYLVNAFHVIVIRTFFQSIPPSLIESAKIDGARELQIFFRIVLPLSKPVIATFPPGFTRLLIAIFSPWVQLVVSTTCCGWQSNNFAAASRQAKIRRAALVAAP